jgi:hypothetical protein
MAFQDRRCRQYPRVIRGGELNDDHVGRRDPNSRTFASKFTSGNTFWGVARNGAEISVGIFTYTSGSPGTIAQTSVSTAPTATTRSHSRREPARSISICRRMSPTYLNLVEITVASATTCDIGAVDGGKIVISGTTTITGLGTSTNKLRFVRFSGALTLTHNGTSLILPGAANIVTVAGDSRRSLPMPCGVRTCCGEAVTDGPG